MTSVKNFVSVALIAGAFVVFIGSKPTARTSIPTADIGPIEFVVGIQGNDVSHWRSSKRSIDAYYLLSPSTCSGKLFELSEYHELLREAFGDEVLFTSTAFMADRDTAFASRQAAAILLPFQLQVGLPPWYRDYRQSIDSGFSSEQIVLVDRESGTAFFRIVVSSLVSDRSDKLEVIRRSVDTYLLSGRSLDNANLVVPERASFKPNLQEVSP